MSHHRHDEEAQTGGIVLSDSGTHHRRAHHTHKHLNPTAVFDHIKAKVKRKQSSNRSLSEIPAFAVHNKKNGNSDTLKTRHDHDELESRSARSDTVASLPALADQSSDGGLDKKEKNVLPKNNGKDAIVPSDRIDKEDNITEGVQWRIDPIEYDIDINQKKTKSIIKPTIRVSKSFSEAMNQSNGKKRRQAIRRTVQSPPKLHNSKKNKDNDLDNMGSFPYSTFGSRQGFQIRDKDFNSIFNDLPSEEQLIIAYPCAWQKDVLMHGRLFLSVNYLCFYTCFFKWEESLCISYKDIATVTKEKSAKILPNAIRLRTSNREQYLFASYIPRERIFVTIYRLWQNALLDKPLDYQQLRTIVYPDNMSGNESSGESEEFMGLENNDEHAPNPYLPSQSLSLTPIRSLEVPSVFKSSISSDLAFSPSSPGDKELANYLSTCPCETHLARTYSDRSFSFHVDKLFDSIFGDNSFSRAYHDSQKLIDYTIGEWHVNNETGKRERLVTYKTITHSILGTNTISCTEKQVMEIDKPHYMYVVNAEVNNEGMKYTDAFYVATRFCMVQRDAGNSSLRISAEIKYVKNVNGIARAFIDKNTHSSIEDGVSNLILRLDSRQAAVCNRRNRTSVSKQYGRHKKHGHTNRNEKKDNSALDSVVSPEYQAMTRGRFLSGKGFLHDIALFVGILLLLLHIYLCYKLYALDQALSTHDASCLNQCEQSCSENKYQK